MSQRDLIAKADFAVANLSAGGLLNPEQSAAFMDKIYDEPTILRDIRRVPMSAPQRYIESIGFASPILKPAPASGVTLAAADRSAPTTGRITLTTKEYIAETHITYDSLEDNIEGGGLESTILGHMAKRIALDLEHVLLLGDTTSTTPLYALQDGVLKLADDHIVALTAPDNVMGKKLFKQAYKALPSKYMRDPSAWRFYMSPKNEIDYRDLLADRQTPVGDTLTEGVRPVSAFGIPVYKCSTMPETKVLLVQPQNLIMGVQRDISIETDKDIRARSIIIVTTMRVAIQIEEADAVVRVDDLTGN